jgi:hypothetical protein
MNTQELRINVKYDRADLRAVLGYAQRHDVDRGGRYDFGLPPRLNIWTHHWINPGCRIESSLMFTLVFDWNTAALVSVTMHPGYDGVIFLDELAKLEGAAVGKVVYGQAQTVPNKNRVPCDLASHRLSRSENVMKMIEKANRKKDERVEVPNHSEKIKSQVLAKIGKLPRLDHVEISRHPSGHYRVNIWEEPEPNGNSAVTLAPRIGRSYYATVSDTGEIIDSDPPMTRLGSPA